MAILKYTWEQRKELEMNQYVQKCSEKYITFTEACKLKYIQLYQQGIFYREIFAQFGFPKYILTSELPKSCSQRWKKVFQEHWVWGFSQKKWRKQTHKFDLNNLSIEEQNEYLRAENAYLRKIYASIHEKSP